MIDVDMLMELARREKDAGIKPDEDLDIFMKALALDGKQTGLVVDYILKILGLDICADTLVGDEMIKGISGGQKKRLTTGELLVGPTRVLFMDEISTGLDRSTTYQIIKHLRNSTHALDGTTVISLLQPAPETYELFDDVVLISEGKIVYQGPRDAALDFFAAMGFKCPERKNVADFLQEIHIGSLIIGSLEQIFRKEGVRGMYRGLSPTVLALLPNWAISKGHKLISKEQWISLL